MSKHCLKMSWILKSIYSFPELRPTLGFVPTEAHFEILIYGISYPNCTVFKISCNSACLKWCSKPLTDTGSCGALGFQSPIPFIDIIYFVSYVLQDTLFYFILAFSMQTHLNINSICERPNNKCFRTLECKIEIIFFL